MIFLLLIPALLPAQLKLHPDAFPHEAYLWAHSGFIAGSIETLLFLVVLLLKVLAHSGFIAGSIETLQLEP